MEVSQSQNRPLIDGRIMIAATGSGNGKTMITCALLDTTGAFRKNATGY